MDLGLMAIRSSPTDAFFGTIPETAMDPGRPTGYHASTMPVTVASLAGTPYNVNGAAVGNGTIHRAEHHHYTLAQSRIALNLTVNPLNAHMRQIGGALAAAGDTIYLRFFADKIASVRLPCPAPVGVTLFVTDNLSACKFFVDTIGGSTDLMVYHANTTQFHPGLAANADAQTVPAGTQLDTYYNNAVGDLAPAVLGNAARLTKPTYFLSAGNAERHKTGAGRVAVSFMGGCTVVGIPHGATWRFYYQTWGDVQYTRPTMTTKQAIKTGHWNYALKKSNEGLTHAVTYASMRVLNHARFY
jgi:hypothetical protein